MFVRSIALYVGWNFPIIHTMISLFIKFFIKRHMIHNYLPLIGSKNVSTRKLYKKSFFSYFTIFIQILCDVLFFYYTCKRKICSTQFTQNLMLYLSGEHIFSSMYYKYSGLCKVYRTYC